MAAINATALVAAQHPTTGSAVVLSDAFGASQSELEGLTPDDARHYLQEYTTTSMKGGELRFGRDFESEADYAYYGYPVDSDAIISLSHYLNDNGHLGRRFEGKLGRVAGTMALILNQFRQQLPRFCVQCHPIATYIPRYLRATDAQFRTDSNICYVWPVVCAREIDDSLIKPKRSTSVREILEGIFKIVDRTPGSPYWFFGGYSFTNTHRWT